MSKKIRELQARKAALVRDARALTDSAAAENRDLTAEEVTKFDALREQIDATSAAIDREQVLAIAEAQIGVDVPEGVVTITENRDNDPRHGFRSFGEFARSVQSASLTPHSIDQRLAAAPTTYGNEASGADGGYAVPPEYARDIFRLALGEDSFIPMTDNTNVTGNSMVFPKDETTPWGTDGIRAYWQAEAAAATQTKPRLGTSVLRLHKLMGLVPLTDELVADTNALDSYLPAKLGDSIRWKSNEAILFGTGAGQPLGLSNSGALVDQAKDGSQTATTVTIGNVTNMASRMMPGSFGRAVWLIHPSVIPQLFQMTLGNYPIFIPINAGIQSQGANFSLLGRPVIITQHCETLGTVGDIQLIDFSYYRTITKAGGVETATSLHLFFDADAVAFRATFRLDGQPKITSYVSPAKGAATLSPFVRVATRT